MAHKAVVPSHLQGFLVSTETPESIELLIRGFRDEDELRRFIWRLRDLGVVTLTGRLGPGNVEPSEPE